MTTYQHNPQTKTLLRTFQLVSVGGLLAASAELLRQGFNSDNWRMLIYAWWFVVSIISVEAVFQWMKIGVYALVGATLAVTVFEITQGYATLIGASLGLLVAFVIIVYLYPVWGNGSGKPSDAS